MRRAVRIGLILASLFVAAEARADWSKVKRYLQPRVRVVSETEDSLVVRAPELQRELVVSRAADVDCDIRASLRTRRGGNPYRVWSATRRLLEDPHLPKPAWGRFFKSQFLRILRR